jgi:hypothetical protein
VYHDAVGGRRRKRVETVRTAPPDDRWSDHLAGHGPYLGICPLREDNTCAWGAIDLDDDTTDHARIAQDVAEARLPLVVCESKSGGAHLFLFLASPAPARLVVERLRSWAKLLELTNPSDERGRVASLEVFPKQVTLKVEDAGNWINLPYYGDTRWAVLPSGERLDLARFLAHAEALMISVERLEAMDTTAGVQAPDLFADGPPCLATLHERGFAAGERNQGLYNVGIFLKLKYPTAWQDLLRQYNSGRVDPPLPDDEVDQIIGSLEKHDYVYKCKDLPIVDFCQRSLCRKRRWGIDVFTRAAARAAMPEMSDLRKILTDPPRWVLRVDDHDVELTTDTLISLSKLRSVVLEHCNIVVPLLKPSEWDDVLRDLMTELNVIDAPEDAGVFGQFKQLVFDFLELRHLSDTRESLLLGKPWSENGTVYFRSGDLIGFLDRKRFRDYHATSEVYTALRSMGAGHKQLNVKSLNVQCWFIPVKQLPSDVELTSPDQNAIDF